MQGKRLSDGEFVTHELRAGEYGRVFRDGKWLWVGCTPNGLIGDFSNHEVIEHEDGSITVTPSIEVTEPREMEIVDGSNAWHGYLDHGVWREV